MIPYKIPKGSLYKNKTNKWLRPILQYILPEYIKKYFKLRQFNIKVLGYFRGDVLYKDATEDKSKDLIFLVMDTRGRLVKGLKKPQYENTVKAKRDFNLLLREIRKSRYAYCDYPCSLKNKELHIIVFKIKGWEKSFEAFDEGKYTDIFTKSELFKLRFTNAKEIHWIVNKDPRAKEIFENSIREKFGVIKDRNIPNTEQYEIPPLKKEEILNFKK